MPRLSDIFSKKIGHIIDNKRPSDLCRDAIEEEREAE
jgi:hypothetical protein